MSDQTKPLNERLAEALRLQAVCPTDGVYISGPQPAFLRAAHALLPELARDWQLEREERERVWNDREDLRAALDVLRSELTAAKAENQRLTEELQGFSYIQNTLNHVREERDQARRELAECRAENQRWQEAERRVGKAMLNQEREYRETRERWHVRKKELQNERDQARRELAEAKQEMGRMARTLAEDGWTDTLWAEFWEWQKEKTGK